MLNQEVQQCLVNAQINNHVITINLLDRPEEVGDDQETENEGEVEEEPICLLNKAAKVCYLPFSSKGFVVVYTVLVVVYMVIT